MSFGDFCKWTWQDCFENLGQTPSNAVFYGSRRFSFELNLLTGFSCLQGEFQQVSLYSIWCSPLHTRAPAGGSPVANQAVYLVPEVKYGVPRGQACFSRRCHSTLQCSDCICIVVILKLSDQETESIVCRLCQKVDFAELAGLRCHFQQRSLKHMNKFSQFENLA